MFHSLGKEQLHHILEIQLKRLRKLLADRNLALELSEEAKNRLTEAGYDPTYGARPLKRVIQRDLENPLSLAILQDTFREGDTIQTAVQDGQLVFSKV